MVAVLSFGVNSLAIATPNDPSLDRNMPLRVWQPDAVTASPLQGNREKKSPSRPSLQLAQNTTVIPVQPRTYPEQETPQDIEIVVPLNENGRYLGDIATKISGDTPFIRLSDATRRSIDATPLGRLVTRAEVAEIVCQLCSPAFDMVTGQTIVMDGGRTIPQLRWTPWKTARPG